jgi:DUF4097 and DUF4098 domain-containing protein YvlB
MTDRTETHQIDPGAHILVSLHAGDVRFKQGDAGHVVISMEGSSDALDTIDVDATTEAVAITSTIKKRRWFGVGSVDMVVTIPSGCDLSVRLGSGDLLVSAPVNDLEVSTGSGDIRIEDVAGTADLKVGSGDMRIGSIHGAAKLSSASGDVRLDQATEVTVSTAAGDLFLGDVSEIAHVKSATGDIRIRRFAGTDLEIRTMSGDVSIGLIPGVVVDAAIKTMSGDFRNRIKPSSGEKTGRMNLSVTSFSGDVTLRSAK